MLSNEAIELLREMLSVELVRQIRDGKDDQPMSEAWRELHFLTIP